MKKTLKILAVVIIAAAAIFAVYLYANYSAPILMYHSLDAGKVGRYAAVAPEVFYAQMRFIKARGYNVMPLDEYCRRRQEGENPRHTVVITFDDGYKDNLYAAEVLREFDFPATIFVIHNNVGGEGYLSEKEIRSIIKRSKIRVGSHTLTHAYLPDADDQTLQTELHASKNSLQRLFGQEIETLAYPIGGFDRRTLKETKAAGYLCACTTNRGFSKRRDLFALRRIKITDRDRGIRLWGKLSGFYNIFKRVKKPF